MAEVEESGEQRNLQFFSVLLVLSIAHYSCVGTQLSKKKNEWHCQERFSQRQRRLEMQMQYSPNRSLKSRFWPLSCLERICSSLKLQVTLKADQFFPDNK